MFNPLVLYGSLAALLIGSFSGWTVRDWKADADALEALEQTEQLRRTMQAKIDSASQSFEEWRSGATERSIETKNTIREIYRDVEVPAECAADAAAVRLLQERIARINAAATGQSGVQLPERANPAAPPD